jgi:hypothetical protein
MTLLFAGLAIFALLVTSYGQRGAWVAWCSTTLSLAALVGLLLVPTVQDPLKFRAHLTKLVRQLPIEPNQTTMDALAAAIAPTASCYASDDPGCPGAKAMGSPNIDKVAVPRPTSTASSGGDAASEIRSETASKDVSASPIIWLLDPPGAATPSASQIVLTGINRSKEPLQQVRATLKPDATKREIALTLNVLGRDLGDEPVIPAGARFTLGLKVKTPNQQIGGAVFAFRYSYAGKRRNLIWYFTPPILARFEPSE